MCPLGSIFTLICLCLIHSSHSLVGKSPISSYTARRTLRLQSTTMDLDQAQEILQEWDKKHTDAKDSASLSNIPYTNLRDAVLTLNQLATAERTEDASQGRVMLGICAPNAQEGLSTLKQWVAALQLPRGLLHGMDVDGVAIDLDGSAVYIKYNSGGSYTFSDIRKSKLGFDALWKPGDALVEMYDGEYRGVYFQVELRDEQFRQYIVPLELFADE